MLVAVVQLSTSSSHLLHLKLLPMQCSKRCLKENVPVNPHIYPVQLLNKVYVHQKKTCSVSAVESGDSTQRTAKGDGIVTSDTRP